MIIGNNSLILNESTMVHALAEYLNARIAEPADHVEVRHVFELSKDALGVRRFEVGIQPAEDSK